MPVEIERKFLVQDTAWLGHTPGVLYRQGYIPTQGTASVRVRLAGPQAFLTIKGKPSQAAPLSRAEYEYAIPYEDAERMLDSLCSQGQIEKTRYRVPFAGKVWEVDIFHGANEGLALAEIELSSEEEAFARPDWLGEEVSLDPRYTNTALAQTPFQEWS